MTKQIRHNVFETNSSSTHAISISHTGVLPSIHLDDAVYLSGGEFGWDWNRFNDWLTKANYMAQSITANPYNEDPYITNEERFNLLRDVIMDMTGAPDVIISATGYIDHQSNNVAEEAWQDENTLRDFIFNPSSYLFTGNDNSEAPLNFYDPDDIKYTHQLRLVGIDYDETLKLSGLPSKSDLQKHLDTLWAKYRNDYSYPRPDYNDESYLRNYDTYHDDAWSKLDRNVFMVQMIQYNRDKDEYELKETQNIQFKLEEL